MIVSQTCDDCGAAWSVRYTGDGSYEYLLGVDPCDCEGTFSADAEVPSITQAAARGDES